VDDQLDVGACLNGGLIGDVAADHLAVEALEPPRRDRVEHTHDGAIGNQSADCRRPGPDEAATTGDQHVLVAKIGHGLPGAGDCISGRIYDRRLAIACSTCSAIWTASRAYE
jgi:hypothetical protein